jgi:hypothetical protein
MLEKMLITARDMCRGGNLRHRPPGEKSIWGQEPGVPMSGPFTNGRQTLVCVWILTMAVGPACDGVSSAIDSKGLRVKHRKTKAFSDACQSFPPDRGWSARRVRDFGRTGSNYQRGSPQLGRFRRPILRFFFFGSGFIVLR